MTSVTTTSTPCTYYIDLNHKGRCKKNNNNKTTKRAITKKKQLAEQRKRGKGGGKRENGLQNVCKKKKRVNACVSNMYKK